MKNFSVFYLTEKIKLFSPLFRFVCPTLDKGNRRSFTSLWDRAGNTGQGQKMGSGCHLWSQPRETRRGGSARIRAGKRKGGAQAAELCIPGWNSLPGCGFSLLQRAGDGSTHHEQGCSQAHSVGSAGSQPCSRGQLRPHHDIHAGNIPGTQTHRD